MRNLKEYTAMSVNFAESCNLDCVYCFNPKVRSVGNKRNAELRAKIESGEFLDILKSRFSTEALTNLSFWGGEPSLNLDVLKPKIREILAEFHKIDTIFWSTNMSTKKLATFQYEFIKELAEFCVDNPDRRMKVEIQISMDGPPEINDANRGKGTAQKVVDNAAFMYEGLASLYPLPKNMLFRSHGKATLCGENLHWLAEEENALRYFNFYEDYYDTVSKASSGKITPPYGHGYTYATPGNFTSLDGKALTKALQILYGYGGYKGIMQQSDFTHIDAVQDQLLSRVHRHMWVMLRFMNSEYCGEFLRLSTCSAGQSHVGMDISGQVHTCQGTFFINDEVLDHVAEGDLVSEFESSQGYSVLNYERFVKDRLVVDQDDPLKAARYQYAITGQHLFPVHRFSAFLATIMECAASGSAAPKYLDTMSARRLAVHLAVAPNTCISNNMFAHGVPFIDGSSFVRLFGNGAYELAMYEFSRQKPWLQDILKSSLGPKRCRN